MRTKRILPFVSEWKPSADVPVVVTHNGVFHADEVAAVSVIAYVFNTKCCRDVRLVRTRDLNIKPREGEGKPYEVHVAGLGTGEVWPQYIVDVGGVYDASCGLYDHHQRSFERTHELGTLKAAFGLVWEDFGKAFVETALVETIPAKTLELLKPEDVKLIEKAIEVCVVNYFDGVDNGELTYGTSAKNKQNAAIPCPSLVDGIRGFNPSPGMVYDAYRNEEYMHNQFITACNFFTTWLEHDIGRRALRILGTRELATLDKGEPIMVLPRYFEHASYTVTQQHITYVVYPAGGKENTYMVEAVPVSATQARTYRAPFPSFWAGKTDEDLEKACGVTGAKFCHKGRWLMSVEGLENAIKVAKIALDYNNEETSLV